MIKAYGDKTQFLTTFNPSNQHLIVGNIQRCLFDHFPTLAEIDKSYDKGTAKSWLIAQLYDLFEYCGVKVKPNAVQYLQLAQTILIEHYYLKVTELMLFFHKFKSGHYGRFYGQIDPLIVTTSLNEFIKFRNDNIVRKEQDDSVKRRIADLKEHKTMSYDEYLKTKQAL